jgi:hypothetical protein
LSMNLDSVFSLPLLICMLILLSVTAGMQVACLGNKIIIIYKSDHCRLDGLDY